ncbi:VCBS repeat-containing protein [Sandaracinus amylolyticus]|nr:VCBS repeat-containing protein [Sandaracinus amylolyticus]
MTALRSFSRALCALAALTTIACGGDDDAPATDAGTRDSGGASIDAGRDDAGTTPDDAGEVHDDASAADAGSDATTEMPDAGTDAGDTTPIPAPRPILPWSTARTTSPTVTFRWALAEPATGARVEICGDPACVTVIEMQDVDGEELTTLVPPDPLPASRVFYWRLTGRAGTRVGTEQSPIWSFSVHGRATVTVSATWGSTYDLDGDGLAEVLAGAPASSVVRLWRGRAPIGGAPPTPSTEISGATPLQLGTAIANGGDLNGDGLGDLVIAGAENAYAFHGVSGALPAALNVTGASTTLASLGALTPARLAIAGDVDRDGYADLVVGEPSMRRVVLFRGGASGLATTGTPIASGAAGFGRSVAGSCDVNGDGYSDLIVGADEAAFVVLGAASGIGDERITLTPAPSSAGFGASVACAGDVNGDGHPDVIVGAPIDHAAFVYAGNASGVGATAVGAVRKQPGNPGGGVTTSHGDGFGSMVAAAGDVNGDEYGDVVVVAPELVAGVTGFVGYAFVFHGSAGGLPITPAGASTTHPRAFGSTPVENRIATSRLAGDVDGDGIDEVVSGMPFRSGGAGGLQVNQGVQTTGLPLAPVWLIEGGVTTALGTTVAWLWGATWSRGS